MKVIAMIPARYASSRMPGKPLVPILGKMMIQRVFEQTSRADTIDDVWVDDPANPDPDALVDPVAGNTLTLVGPPGGSIIRVGTFWTGSTSGK